MTSNQIAYWNLKESEQHNRNTESETALHNRNTEAETYRHNVAGERFSISDLAERQRHNLETERQGNINLQQQKAGIYLRANELAESRRHSIASESETFRSNKAKEGLQASNLSESQRSNLAREMISRSQLAETKRSNVQNERIRDEANKITRARDEATKSYNAIMSKIARFNAESQRALTNDQRRQIGANISKLRNDMLLANRQQNLNTWNTVINGVNALARVVDSVIPF